MKKLVIILVTIMVLSPWSSTSVTYSDDRNEGDNSDQSTSEQNEQTIGDVRAQDDFYEYVNGE